MPRVFAAFDEYRVKVGDNDAKVVTVRTDTRIYFGDRRRGRQKSDKCVGAFFLQNPGSASPDSSTPSKRRGLSQWPWGAVNFDREDLIPLIIDVLDNAMLRAGKKNARVGRVLRRDGYVQLLNLTYVKNAANFQDATKCWEHLVKRKRCDDDVPAAREHFRFLVFGWGKEYSNRRHGERVARMLASCLPCNVQFVFPEGSSVTARKPIATEPACTIAEEIRQQIRRPAC